MNASSTLRLYAAAAGFSTPPRVSFWRAPRFTIWFVAAGGTHLTRCREENFSTTPFSRSKLPPQLIKVSVEATMSRTSFRLQTIFLAVAATALIASVSAADTADEIKTSSGTVEGSPSKDGKIHVFKGIPYAAPPIGDLRWKAPQPVKPWTGVRKADDFGARCMQARIYGDMVFRDDGPSEDCLYLNVWTPSLAKDSHLPVMFWIYGGGFVAGGSSEPRQDGEVLAHKGVVVVSFNYRLGLFGFYAHPELTKESPHHASGNYGLLDQVAALEWVRQNIGNFGGDPNNVTIFGESAGSFSVSALMASPLSKDLFHRAIGESGAFFGNSLRLKSLGDAEKVGSEFAGSVGASSLSALRAKSATDLLEAVSKGNPFRFSQDIDGYFFPEDPRNIFKHGRQAQVALLAGWNHDEGNYHMVFGKEEPTAKNFVEQLQNRFDDHADDALKFYPAGSDAEAKESAGELASDQFIAFSTWKWLELQLDTGGSPVYRYEFDDAPPRAAADKNPDPPLAYHSAEIEFVFEALDSKPLPWRPEDKKLSELISTYWSNFAKTGDPNGDNLPRWPAYTHKDHYQVMHLSFEPHAAPDPHRQRYLFLDSLPPRP